MSWTKAPSHSFDDGVAVHALCTAPHQYTLGSTDDCVHCPAGLSLSVQA